MQQDQSLSLSLFYDLPFLFQLVREQKQRLQERTKSNETLSQQNKQLNLKLERTIEELKKIREQILLLQKERREIDARLVAQESILAGLTRRKETLESRISSSRSLLFLLFSSTLTLFVVQALLSLKIEVVSNPPFKPYTVK